jgi:hypothetical protein
MDKKEKRIAKGAALGLATGTVLGTLGIRKKHHGKGNLKALNYLAKRAKTGLAGGAAAGALYHSFAKKYDVNDQYDSINDVANIVEQDGIKDKLDQAKGKAQKLSQELQLLSTWYSELAKVSDKAAEFIDKHPYVTAALQWGAGKFSK